MRASSRTDASRIPETGSPQGGVVSPMLSNVFLHYVLDEWFEREVQPRLKGRSFLIRYADDFVMGFSCEEDARRVMDVLPKRFDEVRLDDPSRQDAAGAVRAAHAAPGADELRTANRPGTFDLLGFTHYWARSRKGNWVVKRKTSTSRLQSRIESRSSEWCRLNRHRPMTSSTRR